MMGTSAVQSGEFAPTQKPQRAPDHHPVGGSLTSATRTANLPRDGGKQS